MKLLLRKLGQHMEPHKARHLPIILLLCAKMLISDRMVPASSWSLIAFLIGVSATLNTLWHIYIGCVLQLMVWVTNFQHYFTFIDANFLCPTILNSHLLFLLVSIGAVMPVYFEEYHGWQMMHLEWCYNEYCWLFIHSSAHISCDATEFITLL